MKLSDDQRKRGVETNVKLWKKNGRVEIPYQIDRSSKLLIIC